jgi:hypothetical protein
VRCFCGGGGLGLGVGLGFIRGEAGVDLGGLGGVELVIIAVGFGQLFFVEEEWIEPVVDAQFEFLVHFDGVEGADLGADLAAHADADVDVEDSGMFLGFALLIPFQDDVDALGGAFLFADFAGDTAEAGFGVVVKDEEGEGAAVFLGWEALFRVFDRDEAFRIDIAAEEVFGRLGHAFEYAFAVHDRVSRFARFGAVEGIRWR